MTAFFYFHFFPALRISFSLTWIPTSGLVIIMVMLVSVVDASCYNKQAHIIAVQYTGSVFLTPVQSNKHFQLSWAALHQVTQGFWLHVMGNSALHGSFACKRKHLSDSPMS